MIKTIPRPKRLTPIAAEIEGAIAHLLDPQTIWVRQGPVRPHEACALYYVSERPSGRPFGFGLSYEQNRLVSLETEIWLDDFVEVAAAADEEDEDEGSYAPLSMTEFNDDWAKTRYDVWLMFEEALDQAIEDGV
jgi:hypothetical protein